MFLRSSHKKRTSLSAVYIAVFFLSIHMAVTVYLDSSFLAKTFGESKVGAIFVFGYALSVFALGYMPGILRMAGNYIATILLSFVEILLLLALPFFQSPGLIAFLFVLHTAVVTMLLFSFDIFTESRSEDQTTGFTRGIYNTMMNTAVVLGPVIAGFVMSCATPLPENVEVTGALGEGFWQIYIAAAVLMLPVLAILFFELQDFKDPHYFAVNWRQSLHQIWRDDDIFLVWVSNFLLQFFYAVMVIYMPVYLNTHIGFSWSDIGVIFGIMLLPFVFFELPLGKLADEKLGEKEIMVAGFLLISITTFSLSFLTLKSIALWSMVLFMTRVGAAAIEIMTETYFFKKISGKDSGLVAMFRHTKPIAYIVAPLLVSFFLLGLPMQYLFVLLGFLMFIAIPIPYAIEDTK